MCVLVCGCVCLCVGVFACLWVRCGSVHNSLVKGPHQRIHELQIAGLRALASKATVARAYVNKGALPGIAGYA